ncbi:MAG: ABC transporter substrate-binding protein [Nannocystaceae bacterium]|nr:ABC transporter substrate-binding protein [bacterium]
MTRAGLLLLACLAAGCPRPAAEPPAAARIASVTIDSDATLWALGEDVRGQVVAVSALVDDARYSPIVDTWPASIPRVSGSSETLIALRPTVAFVAEWSDPNGRALLERSDIDVVVLSGFGGFDDYRARVRTIAERAGAPERGRALVAEFDEALDQVTSSAGAGLSVVSYASGNVAAADTTFADEAAAAGLTNLPSTKGMKGHVQVGIEQLVAWAPDVLVVPCEDDCAKTERDFATKPGIAATPAAQHDRIIAIEPALLFATGPRMLDVTAALVRRLREADP